MNEIGNDSTDFPSTVKGKIELQKTTNLRHVDVAILYGLGQKNRAHGVAKKMKPLSFDEKYGWSDEEIREFCEEYITEESSIREKADENGIRSGKGTGWFSKFLFGGK